MPEILVTAEDIEHLRKISRCDICGQDYEYSLVKPLIRGVNTVLTCDGCKNDIALRSKELGWRKDGKTS